MINPKSEYVSLRDIMPPDVSFRYRPLKIGQVLPTLEDSRPPLKHDFVDKAARMYLKPTGIEYRRQRQKPSELCIFFKRQSWWSYCIRTVRSFEISSIRLLFTSRIMTFFTSRRRPFDAPRITIFPNCIQGTVR
ncbi:hypothetical protein O6H91_17G057200 [Diphasiastrum complanatum]|uniref:Uncharacterized protein n=1 Tax=Diphasiastrum complanatum TaxID=34168 RepID=A0ACC2B792_DIPCM|nr:hypothetical protein O6H91_17G057200 [Diphasiastrum complanatum]